MSTLVGWVGGDSFKYSHISIHARLQTRKFIIFLRTVYFFAQGSPLQFKICAIFQVSVDIGKCRMYQCS